MKTLKTTFLISLMLSTAAVAQDGWTWHNPKPTVMNLNAVHFPISNSFTGWAVGHHGTILKTTNGGVAWSLASSLGTSVNLEGLWLTSLYTGWAVGAEGTILKTGNQGNSWEPQNSGVAHDLKAAHFLTGNVGWVVGYSGTTGVILHTTNSGTVWTSQTYPGARFTAVRMFDEFIGYAAGLGGVLYKTVDGGISWFALNSGITADLRGLHFLSSETGWAVGANGTILHTADGGFTWTQRASQTTRTLTSVHFSKPAIGWAVGDDGQVVRTTNGGVTWTPTSTGAQNLHMVQGVGDTVWAVGARGQVLRSLNAGAGWTSLSSGTTTPTLASIHFPSAAIGYAAGHTGAVLKSIDFGTSWSALATGTSNAISALHFPDTATGYAVGPGGFAMKTTDGGLTWTPLSTGTSNNLNAVHFTSPQRGFIVGATGLIRTTSDGGQTWSTPNYGSTTQNLVAVKFATPAVGWAVGGSAIRKTVDSGATWTTPSGNVSQITGLHVFDENNAIALRQSGSYRTTNGGTNWTSISISTGGVGQFRAITFNGANGYVASTAGRVGFSTDSGLSWSVESVLRGTDSLHALTVAPGGRVFVAGSGGIILKVKPPAPVGFYYGGNPYVFGNGYPISPITPAFSGVVSSFSVTPALPSGLHFNTQTGVISGMPVAVQSTTTHSVSAYNETGVSATQLNITVRNPLLSFDYAVSQLSLARGTAITPLTPTVTGQDPFGPYNCTSFPPLPTGLSLAPGTCVLSGTPANAQAAVNYIITVSNGFASFNKSDTIRINVVAPPSNFTYAAPQTVYTVGVPITPNPATVSVVTGATLHFSAVPPLPQGLILDTLTGTISGTPTKSSAPTNHIITVTSAAGSTTFTLNITVHGPPSDIVYPTVVFGVNVPDSGRGSPTAAGSITRWSIQPPPPAGLFLDTATGKFSGTATEASSGSAHTITGSNSYGTTSAQMTISVLNPIVLFSYATKNFTLLPGVAMTAVSPIVAGTIPFTPVTYSANPPLPAGISLNTNTGAISGTPAPAASSLTTKHVITARNGVPAFNKNDTLSFLVTSTALFNRKNVGGFNHATLWLGNRSIILDPPAHTRNLRVTLRDLRGRTVLERRIKWPGEARLNTATEGHVIAGGVHVLTVHFLDAQGNALGKMEQRVPMLP